MTAGASRKLVVALSGLALAVALLLALPAAASAASRPVVTSVSPAKGPALGGTSVTVRGRNFRVAGRNVVKGVKFGSRAATKIHVVSATKLRCQAPRGVGVVNVRVVTTAGISTSRKADRFAYQGGPPVVTGVSPAYGPTTGGTAVTIVGSGFTGATSVTFGLGGARAKFSVVSDNSISAMAPAGSAAGDPYDVTVSTPLGTSPAMSADQFNYYAVPTVTSVSPANGPQQGGTVVTIHGDNLYTARNITGAVQFGGVVASSMTVNSSSTITVTVPAGTGTVDVTVTTYGGTSATSSADLFSYATTIAPAPGSVLDQSQVVGASVGTPPSVEVTDGLGNPVAGVAVTFAATAGGGSVTPATVTTDITGIATATSWTLGDTAGTDNNTVTATAAGLNGSPVTFTASALSGAPEQIAAGVGSGQTADAGTEVAVVPTVVVTDADGNPVSGVSVSFKASGDGVVGNATATTNGLGVASAGSWTLASAAGNNTLTATAAGLAGSPVTFTATGEVGPAASIAANSATTQTADAGAEVATLPSVLVTDAHGNPVAGVAVTFAVTAGGGSITGAKATTGADGVATVGSWTLGDAPGANMLTATAAGLAGSPVTFDATGDVGPAAEISANAGDGQSAAAGTDVTTAPSVLVTDAVGNPVSGVSVSFQASGDGAVGNAKATTDSSGIASCGSWTLATSAGTNSLTASSGSLQFTFTATGTVGAAADMVDADPPDDDDQTATVGTAVATPPSVLVTDTYGNPVQGVTVAFTVASGGGSLTGAAPTTNASGVATVGSWTLGDTPGDNSLTASVSGLSGSPVTFTATGTVGAAADMVDADPPDDDDQTATVGTAVATPPSVLVTDTYGNPVQGVTVSFTPSGPSGPGAVGDPETTTDSSGIASCGSWTLDTSAGTNTLTAACGSLQVTFTATGTT
jgi:adhesin/invasin